MAGSCCCAPAPARRAALSLRIFSGTPLQTNRSLESLGRGLSGGHRVVRLLRHTDLLDCHWRRSCLDFDTHSLGMASSFFHQSIALKVVPLKGGQVAGTRPIPLGNRSGAKMAATATNTADASEQISSSLDLALQPVVQSGWLCSCDSCQGSEPRRSR